MTDILSYPLGPLPWALLTPDGLLRKTNKASLATCLQKKVTVAEELPDLPATVVDGMNLVQQIKGDQTTFGEVAKSVLSMALRDGCQSKRVDVVFDTYKEISMKNSERSVRGEAPGPRLQSITVSHIVRQWRNFLSKINKKTSLITFLVNEWKKVKYTEQLQDKVLFATVDDKCYKISPEGRRRFLLSGGHLLLHATQSVGEGYKAAVISSEDTDVFIMCLALNENIRATLYVLCPCTVSLQCCYCMSCVRALCNKRRVAHIAECVV